MSIDVVEVGVSIENGEFVNSDDINKYALTAGFREVNLNLGADSLRVSFNYDYPTLDKLSDFMRYLREISGSYAIATYYVSSAGETIYFTLIDDEIHECSTESEVHELHQNNVAIIENAYVANNYDKKKTTLLLVTFKNSVQLSEAIKVFKSSEECTDVYFDKSMEFFKRGEIVKEWHGEITEISPYLDFVIQQNNRLIMGYNVFDVNLTPFYPEESKLINCITENYFYNENPTNDEVLNKYKTLSATELARCCRDIRRSEIYTPLECFLENVLSIKGVKSGELSFRHGYLFRNSKLSYAFNKSLGIDSWDVEPERYLNT